MIKAWFAAGSAVLAAFVSALCCFGPLLAVALGISGAGLASTFEPLRPYFLGLAGLSLATGFFVLRQEERKACEPGSLCASPQTRRRMRIALWVATVVAVIFVTYPQWSEWFLE